MDNQELELLEEEESSIVTFVDENGEDCDFEFLDCIEYEGKEYQFLQYMTIKGAYVYIFTYTAENEKNEILGYVPYEKNLEEVLNIISEFKFK